MNKPDEDITSQICHLFREEAGKLTAVLIRRFGFHYSKLAEDIIQETFLAALKIWPANGIPENPSGWLMQVAKNKTLNALKKEKRIMMLQGEKMADISSSNGVTHGAEAVMIDEWFSDSHIKDSQLRVLLTCCHPDFPEKARIMLTLKTLAGFSYAEIARGLLVNEENVRKTLYRIRNQIRENSGTLKVPLPNQISARLDGVLTILYLMFNEGYQRTDGQVLIGEDISYEAMRLTKLLSEAAMESPGKIYALMALMCLNAARFSARMDEEGHIVDLKDQDRTLWDRELMSRGFKYLKQSRKSDQISRYHLEAGIASTHCAAESFEQTDWKTILFYYNPLMDQSDSVVTKINRAIALSYVKGAEAGLQELEPLENNLSEPYHIYHAARADMCFRLGEYEKARSFYEVALHAAKSKPEKQFLERRLEECLDRQ